MVYNLNEKETAMQPNEFCYWLRGYFNLSGAKSFDAKQSALVLSTLRFSKATGFTIVVPGTTKYHPEQKLAGQHLMVKLPTLTKLTQEGWLCHAHFRHPGADHGHDRGRSR